MSVNKNVKHLTEPDVHVCWHGFATLSIFIHVYSYKLFEKQAAVIAEYKENETYVSVRF